MWVLVLLGIGALVLMGKKGPPPHYSTDLSGQWMEITPGPQPGVANARPSPLTQQQIKSTKSWISKSDPRFKPYGVAMLQNTSDTQGYWT